MTDPRPMAGPRSTPDAPGRGSGGRRPSRRMRRRADEMVALLDRASHDDRAARRRRAAGVPAAVLALGALTVGGAGVVVGLDGQPTGLAVDMPVLPAVPGDPASADDGFGPTSGVFDVDDGSGAPEGAAPAGPVAPLAVDSERSGRDAPQDREPRPAPVLDEPRGTSPGPTARETPTTDPSIPTTRPDGEQDRDEQDRDDREHDRDENTDDADDDGRERDSPRGALPAEPSAGSLPDPG